MNTTLRERVVRVALTIVAVRSGALRVAEANAAPYVTAVGSGGTIVHTDDGGGTWVNQNPYPGIDLLAVDFVDRETGWTGGEYHPPVSNSGLLRTSDGAVWGYAGYPNTINNFFVNGIDFVNPSTGWLVGGNGNIWRTDDGSTHWSQQITAETLADYHAVDFVDGNNGWAVGNVIVHTSDGGATWQVQHPVFFNGSYFASVKFVDKNNGWVVGNGNMILHTTNGGDAWAGQSNPSPSNLRDVAFATPTVGWIVGANGTILHTTDAGSSWVAQSSGTTALLNAVAFVNVSEGWAAGESGTILHTIDGGQSWLTQNSGTDQSLYDLAAIPEPSSFAMCFAGLATMALVRFCRPHRASVQRCL